MKAKIREMLWYFQKTEKIRNDFLVKKGFAQEIIDTALLEEYICVVEDTSDAFMGDIKYKITQKGIELRDSHEA